MECHQIKSKDHFRLKMKTTRGLKTSLDFYLISRANRRDQVLATGTKLEFYRWAWTFLAFLGFRGPI